MNILRIGRYRVLRHLGGGATSEVYLAEDTMLGRKVALKVLRRKADDPRQDRRFEREARRASIVNHPNIVTIFDAGSIDGTRYIAMEYVEGRTLRWRLDHGPMTALEVVEIGMGVSSALAAAHEAWLVHRDIKPENVVLRVDGVVKVLDFGVATLPEDADATDPVVRPGSFAGTLHYLSPEQVRGTEIVDTRADIFALGVVLHEMLAGVVPFRGADIMETLAAIVEAAPPELPQLVPEPLRRLVAHCLQKDLYQRPQTAAEVLAALTAVRLDLMISARANSVAAGA